MMVYRQPCSFLLLALVTSIVSGNNGMADAYDWSCNMFCYNKGVCRHGHGKFGSHAGIDSTNEQLPFEQELHENGMYCTCPEGYTGLQCEIKYVTCGRDDHTCFNGSSCVKERSSDNGNTFYRCECDIEGSVMDAPYAGKYCEHIATIFCDGGDGFTHGQSFCTNGGRCRKRDPDSSEKHHGCDCPDGWEGSHCELQIKQVASVTGNIVKEAKEAFSGNDIVWIIIGGIMCLFVFAYFRRYHMIKQHEKRPNRRRRKNQEMTSYSDTRDII